MQDTANIETPKKSTPVFSTKALEGKPYDLIESPGLVINLREKGSSALPRQDFPFEVFPENIEKSMLEISKHYNIPNQYLGSVALWTIGALSGNMYSTELGTKTIIYMLSIGPSGAGKTPAYKMVCGNLISSLRSVVHERYLHDLKEWKERRAIAKDNKREFTEAQPNKPVRMMEEATLEAVLKEAEFSPAGQGLVYDEGARLFSGLNQYKKESSSIDVINELWNGQLIEIYRSDSDRNRHIGNPAISILGGLQNGRMAKYFTDDVIHSGLLYRFLMCESDYTPLVTDVDYFNRTKQEMCEGWRDIVTGLFSRGLRWAGNSEQIIAEFTPNAKREFNIVKREITEEQNKCINSAKKGDSGEMILSYMAKLQAYVDRLSLILAIIEDHTQPTIHSRHVKGAYALYKYYKHTADRVIRSLFEQSTTGLTDNEAALLDALPEQFTSQQAESAAELLGLGLKFFYKAMTRKYSKGRFVRKIKPGFYEKL